MAEIITGNYRLLKDLNSNIVLNLVRTSAPISGAELAKITGMRPSTIHNILKNLEKRRLIKKIGIGDSTKLGGRRPTLWKIRGNYGYVIGIQLEINEIEIVVLDMNSRQIDEQRIATQGYKDLSDVKDKIIKIVDDILNINKINKNRLLGMGFGVSGLVDIKNGIIIKTSLLPTKFQPIKFGEYLTRYFGVPVYVENDANAAALAEKWFGKASGVDDIIYVLTVIGPDGFGIGFGLILNDQIYRGANMYAGETEFFDINIEKILKSICGYNEPGLTISGEYIAIGDLQLDHLLEIESEGSELASRFFEELGTIIGQELLNVIYMLDPKLVVIGGVIRKAHRHVLEPIRKVVEQKTSRIGNHEVEIVGSSFSKYSVALGAATIILRKLFRDGSADHAITMNKAI